MVIPGTICEILQVARNKHDATAAHTRNSRIPAHAFADKMIQNEDVAGIPLLILVNKLDVPDCVPIAAVREQFSVMPSVVGDRPAKISPISALTGYEDLLV